MNQAEAQYREILHTLDKLLTNLGLMLEDYDVEYLTQADLYIEIYKVMFPVLEPALNVNFGEDISDEEIIQYLINLLAKDIIKMDLDHIKGELIAQGEAKSILNFLQLLFEISNMVVDKDDGKKKSKKSRKNKHQKLVKSSANSVDHASNHSQKSSEADWKQKYNSVLGINAEFSNSSATGESVYDPNQEEEVSEEHHEAAESELKRQANKSSDHQVAGSRGESNFNSQSASRVSETNKSGAKQKYDEYGSHQRSSGQKPLSRNSENIRQQEHFEEEDEEGSYQVQDGEEVPEDGEEEYEYGQNHQAQYAHSGHGQEGEEQIEEEEDHESYYEQNHPDYQGVNQYYDQHDREDIRAIDRKAEHMMHRDEHSQQQEEYEDEEEYPQDSQPGEEYVEEYPEEVDPRAMRQMEDVEEVIEEHDEGNEESKTYDQENQPNYYNQVQYVANQTKVRPKSGVQKTKPKTTGKKKKSSKLEENNVEYRQLHPPTAGMKKTKQTKSAAARKSKESSSVKKKHHKLVHSKSERNLNMEGEDEANQDSQVITEEVSEDMAMEPKEYPSNEEVEGESQNEEHEEGQGEYVEDQLQNIPDGNIFKILSENVMRVKENLRDNREIQDIAFDDDTTVKIITQQKNQYKQYLNDFMKDHQMREKKFVQLRGLAEKNFMKKMKSEKIRDDNLKKDFENQQKSLYYKMRDEKVNYLRKVHKTIFELEKKRIIEDKKEYMDFRKTKNFETRNMIDSIKSEYRNKLDILREKNKNEENERKIANEAQRAFLQALEKELRTEQTKEVHRVKDKWRHEKDKFEMMMKDEGFLQQRVMQLYKKGTF